MLVHYSIVYQSAYYIQYALLHDYFKSYFVNSCVHIKVHTLVNSCVCFAFITPLSCHSIILRDTFLKIFTTDEKNLLHLILEDKESGYRTKIILLKDEEYIVPQIRKITKHHNNNIRKWIHRFNEKGIDGIISKKHNHKQHKFDNDMEKNIVDISSSDPIL